ncbi:hypothetical protein [Microbacterium sp. CJ88]|uniref:hypothetical protein n=1 Tax=Microbacterium sp. CJ88 TaxID=3445672 RepID=UPI003F659DE4
MDIPITTDLKTLLPPVSEELMNWASSTQDALADNSQFSTVNLADDRKSAQIYWYGERTPELTGALKEAPSAYTISVVPTAYEPGTLRQAALDLLDAGEFDGAAVTATWPKYDGSGIGIKVDQLASNRSADVPLYQGLPIEVSEGSATPAVGRQDDNLHIGGSRLIRSASGSQCTLGFAVQAPNDPSQYAQGGMFASHCGDSGDQWVRPSSTGTYYYMGTTASEVNDRDGAILHGTFFQPAVYIGSYTSDAYVGITGVNNPVNGTEICYSESA